jgi:hypothetical protein
MVQLIGHVHQSISNGDSLRGVELSLLASFVAPTADERSIRCVEHLHAMKIRVRHIHESVGDRNAVRRVELSVGQAFAAPGSKELAAEGDRLHAVIVGVDDDAHIARDRDGAWIELTTRGVRA